MELLVDRRRIEQKEVDIEPGGDGVGRVFLSFRAAGRSRHRGPRRRRRPGHRQSSFSGRAGAAGDPRACASTGGPPAVPFHGAADYLAVALAAARTGRQPGHALVQAEVAPESAMMDRNLGRYDCVFLCNVAQFTASEARVLDAYLQQRRQPGLLPRRPGAGRPLQPRVGRGGAGQGRGAAPLARPTRPPGRSPAVPASIRWAIAIRSCNRFAAAARPAC